MKKYIYLIFIFVFSACGGGGGWEAPHYEPMPSVTVSVDGQPFSELKVGFGINSYFDVLVLDDNNSAIPGVELKFDAPYYIIASADLTNSSGISQVAFYSEINPVTEVRDSIKVNAYRDGKLLGWAVVQFVTAIADLNIRDGMITNAVYKYPEGTVLDAECDDGRITVSTDGAKLTIVTDGESFGLGEVQPVSFYVTVNGKKIKTKLNTYKRNGTFVMPFTVSTPEELAGIKERPDLCYYLARNIDLAGIDWAPLDNFSGTLFGDNHTIKNLRINSDRSNQGFFGTITGGRVERLHISGEVVSTGDNVSIIAGRMIKGMLDNVSADGTVSGHQYVGLISGNASGSYLSIVGRELLGSVAVNIYESDATIRNVFAVGNVHSSAGYSGGLVGYVSSALMLDGYAIAEVRSEGNYAGGLCGRVNNTVLRQFYVLGNVTGKDYVGGAYGRLASTTVDVYTAVYALNNNVIGDPDGNYVFRVGYMGGGETMYSVHGAYSDLYVNKFIDVSVPSADLNSHGGTITSLRSMLSGSNRKIWENYISSREFRLPILRGRVGTIQDTLKFPEYLQNLPEE